jgi:hypothetical protein
MVVHRQERWILAALLGAALAGPAAQAEDGPLDHVLARILAEAGPPPVLAPLLAVDAAASHRTVVVDKCEEAGELELGELTQTAALEEAFAFLPDRCLWIDVGVEQTAQTVRAERGLIDALAGAFGTVVLYHIHLDRKDSEALYLPAYSDFLALVLMNARYLRDPNVEIRHRAITPREIFEYSFHPTGAGEGMVDVIFSTGLGDFAGENLLLRYGDPRREAEYHDAIRNCMKRFGEGARLGACFPMRAGDFVLAHRPRHPEAARPSGM